ncbi:MAG TPA: hypothetical protein VFD43_11615, partial [Planctomycetota bacterium]|nr:hypothetical protein [Planctomycetota bacterium]
GAAGGSDGELRFELQPGAAVVGEVRTAGAGATLQGLRVLVRVEDSDSGGATAYSRSAEVRPDGRFEVRNLPAGQAALRLLRFTSGTAAGADPWAVVTEKSCALVAGETATVEFTVGP